MHSFLRSVLKKIEPRFHFNSTNLHGLRRFKEEPTKYTLGNINSRAINASKEEYCRLPQTSRQRHQKSNFIKEAPSPEGRSLPPDLVSKPPVVPDLGISGRDSV